jgi:hypothetical protein
VDHIDRIIEAWRRERPDVDVTALGRFSRIAAAQPPAGPQRSPEETARDQDP